MIEVTMDSSSLPVLLPSSLAGALSRIHINSARVVLTGNGNRVYSSTGDISVHFLVIQHHHFPSALSPLDVRRWLTTDSSFP
jgi:hypothetical protein